MEKKQLWLNLKEYHFDHLVLPHLWDFVRASGRIFISKIIQLGKDPNKHSLNVYPNPATNIVSVQSSVPFTANKMIVKSLGGEKVLEQTGFRGSTHISIDLSGVKSGMYIGVIEKNSGVDEIFLIIKK